MNTEIAIHENQSISLTSIAGFELGLRIAKMMASSSLVPKEYQNNVANCAIALNMSARIGADPLQVMQSLVVVHGRPTWSSQFLIATFNQCGRFSSIRYRFSGTGDDYGCTAFATEKSTGETIESSRISIELAKKEGWYSRNGSKWQTMPQQMLMYRSAAWLVRAYAPELSMGLQTREEMADVFDAEKTRSGSFEVVSDINDRLARASEPPADVDTETGEITDPFAELRADPEYADWCSAVESKQTIGELAALMNSMDKKTKAAMHAFLETQQDRIKSAA